MLKGTMLHEVLHLPPYWASIRATPDCGMQVTRHAYGAHSRQYLLFARPPAQVPLQRQAMVFFHGGAWRFGTPEQFIGYARFFTSLGYLVFLPSYRRIPVYRFAHMHEDLIAMLREIMQLADAHGGVQTFVSGGMSAGGHMAAILAHDTVVWEKAGLKTNPIAGLLACGAPLDLDYLSATPVLLRLAGKRNGNLYQQANPVWHLQQCSHTLPMLFIHGTADGLVPIASAQSFLRRAQEKSDAPLEFHLIEKGTHLDAGRWVFQEDAARERMVRWLQGL